MNFVKKGLVYLLAFVILFLSMPSVKADKAIDDKASILNKLSILQGDGVSFNLTGQLSRSEAIAFIVRIMGQETHVTSNKEKYINTPFSDVKKTDWFAATVGFGVEQKIVNGFPDGKFHPNESISEKAFLTLLLGALGHSPGLDFKWETVYQYAVNIGLLDQSYQVVTSDNLNYKRADVVNVLTTALEQTNKNTNKKVIDLLDPNHTLVPSLAPTPVPTPTPIPDKVITAVSAVNVISESKVSVTFNENIKIISPTDIISYETGNKNGVLKTTVDSITNNVIVINTDIQKANQNYTIEFNNVTDMDGNKVSSLTSNFTGFVKPEIKSDLFKLSKIETLSKNMLNVYFTQPINTNVEIPIYYEVLKNNISLAKGFNNLTAKAISSTNNGVTILLNNAFISNPGIYTIKISGELTSIYGVKLNDGNGDSMSFASNTSENAPFEVVDVMPIDNKTIQVTFNQEVDPISIQQQSNYSMISSNAVPSFVFKAFLTGEGDLKGKVVQLSLSSAFDNTKSFTLTIKNIKNKLNQITMPETKLPFIGQGTTSRKDLQILNATPIDNQTLDVFLDHKLDATSALNTTYYSLVGITNPGFVGTIAKAFYDPIVNPYEVKLYLAAGSFAAGSTYKLQILSPMKDDIGQMSVANATINFVGNDSLNIKPLIYEAMIIGKDTIRVRTSEEILNTGANVVASNYTLEYKEGSSTIIKPASSVSLIDATTGIIKFDSLDSTKVYTLKVTTLTDYANLNIRTAADGLNSISVSAGK